MGLRERMLDWDPTPPRDPLPSEQVGARPTPQEHFDSMTPAEQDEAFGADVAEALRKGEITLGQLVTRSPMETEPDFITQATAADLGLGEKGTPS